MYWNSARRDLQHFEITEFGSEVNLLIAAARVKLRSAKIATGDFSQLTMLALSSGQLAE
jgi:hypothetical protein